MNQVTLQYMQFMCKKSFMENIINYDKITAVLLISIMSSNILLTICVTSNSLICNYI